MVTRTDPPGTRRTSRARGQAAGRTAQGTQRRADDGGQARSAGTLSPPRPGTPTPSRRKPARPAATARTGAPSRSRPAARPEAPARPAAAPARPAAPPRRAAPQRPAAPKRPAPPARPSSGPGAVAGRRTTAQRMPFILLLVGLLCGALVCVLVISTTLAAGSFRITSLQQQDQALAKEQQQLQQQVAQDQAPSVIAQRAEQLGMRPVNQLRFLNVKTGKISTNAATGANAAIQVPGYTP